MSDESIRLTVRCPHRILLEVDTGGMVRMKCRDCSRKQGRPVYHEIPVADLAARIGTLYLAESAGEDHPKAA